MGAGSPSIDQDSFRFRNDDGSEAAASWLAALNVNPTLEVDTIYRLRFLVQNVGTGAISNMDLAFQYNRNGAGWNNITTASAVVRAVDSPNLTNAADCTQQLGSGTFHTNNDGVTEDGISGGNALDLANGAETETELAFQIIGADVADEDSIQIRLVRDGGALLDSYTNTPTITVNKVASASLDLDATESGSDTLAADVDVAVAAALAVSEAGSDTLAADVDALLAATLAASEVGADVFAGNVSILETRSLDLAAVETGQDTFASEVDALLAAILAAVEVGADVAAVNLTNEGAPAVAPMGVVPVRYIVGEIPNVVPVETVLTSEAGVVPVREYAGPANVVPVREASSETPRVKVRKV